MNKKTSKKIIAKFIALAMILSSIMNFQTAAYASTTASVPVASSILTPLGMAFDGDGNVYYTDYTYGKINKIDHNGGTPEIVAQGLNIVSGIACDNDGNLYVGTSVGLKKIDQSGTVTSFGSGTSVINGVAIDSNGYIYVAENTRIIKMDSNGNTIDTFIGFTYAWEIAFDSDDNMYVTDITAGVIKRIDASNKAVTIIASGLVNPSGIAITSTNIIYLTTSTGKLMKMDLDGGNISTIVTEVGEFFYVKLDGDENVYYTNKSKGTINELTRKVVAVSEIQDINVANGTTKDHIGLPENVTVTLDNSKTTKAAVTWDNGAPTYSGDTEGTYVFTGTLVLPSYIINLGDFKATVNVKVSSLDTTPVDGGTPPTDDNPTPIEDTTTPASVRINGTERVGKTLEAVLLTEGGAKFTTSAGVTYEWFRLSDENSSDGEIIGHDKTYKLVGSDKSQYIKVVADYNGKTFEDITSKILKKSSNNSSSSSSSNSTNNNSSKSEVTKTTNGWENKIDNTKSYIENGHAVVGWKQIDGSWYLFDSIGTMQRGWRQQDKDWYYLENNGEMAIGWKLIENKWYLLQINGSMVKGWSQMNDKWYYLNNDGSMATGWINVYGSWYYLYEDGSMARNTVVNGYKVNENGAWVK